MLLLPAYQETASRFIDWLFRIPDYFFMCTFGLEVIRDKRPAIGDAAIHWCNKNSATKEDLMPID